MWKELNLFIPAKAFNNLGENITKIPATHLYAGEDMTCSHACQTAFITA